MTQRKRKAKPEPRQVKNDVGEQVERLRKAANLSRAELAEKLKWSELKVWRIEKGETRMLADDVPLVAEALSQPVGALFGEAV